MDEDELITQCVKGNPKAQHLLFENYAPKMMSVALRYMKNTQEAEDVLQDGFVKIFNKLTDYLGGGSFEGWIRRIIVNSCLDQIRKNKKFQKDIEMDSVDFKLENNAHIEEGLMADDLMILIHKMPDGYKVVFNLFAIEGYSHSEIAEMLGVSENTSKSQYSRAKDYMRKQLQTINYARN